MLKRNADTNLANAWASALGEAELPPLVGALTGVEDRCLVGWIRDPTRPLRSVVFDLLAGTAAFGRHIANLPVAGQDAAEAARAPNGFSVSLAGLPPGPHVFALRDIASGRTLTLQADLPEPGAGTAGTPVLPAITYVRSLAPQPDAVAEPAAADPAAVAALLQGTRPQDLHKLVDREFKAKNWPMVVALTDRAAARLGRSADHRVVVQRGRALIYVGRFEEAADTLRWFETNQPKRHDSLFFLGVALSNLHQIAEAREVFMTCMKASPDEKRYVFEVARVTARLANGDYGTLDERPALLEEAIALTRRAVQLMPTDARPLRDLAHLVLQSGGSEEGLGLLRQAVQLAPAHAVLHLDLSRALARVGRVEEALEEARQAARLDPLRDGAAFACRILERWLAARRHGPFTVAAAGASAA